MRVTNPITQWFSDEVEKKGISPTELEEMLCRQGWTVKNFEKQMEYLQGYPAATQTAVHELARAIAEILGIDPMVFYKKLHP